MLYGAIIGDVAGSEWEFHGMKQRPDKLITKKSCFTDDTVMTVAVAEALMNDADIATTLRSWGAKHPFPTGGYGGNFARWLKDSNMGAYNSFGNGSAMRVSAAGWMADSLSEAVSLAERTAEVSHNHPEGIKGAQATAGAIYLARMGCSKDEIHDFLVMFGYDLSRTCNEIRPGYFFNETCQGTIPEAMTAFLESENFEDCLELCISLGGDADTLCAIAGSVAEAFYGVPEYLIREVREKLPDDILAVVDRFEQEVKA